MENIYAAFDTQGFTIDGAFYPAEVTLYSPEGNMTIRVDQPVDCEELSVKDRQGVDYLQQMHHGLKYKDAIVTEDEAMLMIQKFWSMISKNKSCWSVVGVKSKLAFEWLEKCKIPAINLTGGGATWNNLSRITNKEKPCAYHSPLKCNKRAVCSLLAAKSLWRWIDTKKEQGEDAWYDYPNSRPAKHQNNLWC